MRTVQKKVCLLGDFAVGKTSLIRRFVEGRFDDKYLSTIGVKISRKSLARPDHVLNLLIWDLAGGEDYSKMGAHYLRGAVGALLVCDLTRPETLALLPTYAQQLRALKPDAALVLAGNKLDLHEAQQISEAALAAAADELGAPYILTSAKSGAFVEDAFHQLAAQIEAQL